MPVNESSQWRVLSRLYPYLRQHRGRLAAGFVAVILSNAFQMMGPWVMGRAVDSLYDSVTQRQLLTYAGILIGLTLLEGICRFASRWWFIGASRDMEYSLRQDVFTHLEALPMSFYHQNKTGELMSRATNDLSNVRMLLGPGIMYSANTVVTAVVAVGFMLSIDWRLTLVVAAPDAACLGGGAEIRPKNQCFNGAISRKACGPQRSSSGEHGGRSRREGVLPGGAGDRRLSTSERESCGEEQSADSRDQCFLPAHAVRDRTGHRHHPLVWRPGGGSRDRSPGDSSFSSSSTWARWPGR